MKADTVDRIRYVRSVLSFSLVLLIGLAFFGFALKMSLKKIPENYIETQAVITRIEEERLPGASFDDDYSGDKYEYHVFVEYSCGGRTYGEVEYGSYKSSMKVGDTVLLYANPENPAEFIGDPSDNIAFVIAGAVVVLIGGIGLGVNLRNRRKGM